MHTICLIFECRMHNLQLIIQKRPIPESGYNLTPETRHLKTGQVQTESCHYFLVSGVGLALSKL